MLEHLMLLWGLFGVFALVVPLLGHLLGWSFSRGVAAKHALQPGTGGALRFWLVALGLFALARGLAALAGY